MVRPAPGARFSVLFRDQSRRTVEDGTSGAHRRRERETRGTGLGHDGRSGARACGGRGILADAPARIEFTSNSQDTALWAVSAVQEPQVGIATRTGSEIHLWTRDASNLVGSLIDGVLPLNPGEGSSANVSVEEFEQAHEALAEDGTVAFRDALSNAGVPSHEISIIMRTVDDVRGGGSLAVNLRDELGNWEHATLRMSWVDTAVGRYAIRQDDEWVTITPADSARLNVIGGEILAQLESAE